MKEKEINKEIYSTHCECGNVFHFRITDVITEYSKDDIAGYVEEYDYVRCPICGKVILV